MRLSRRARLTRLARLATAAVTASVMVFATADAIAAPTPGGTPPTGEKPAVVYRALALPDGKTATVYSNGMAEIRDLAKGLVEDRMLPMTDLTPGPTGPALTAPKSQVIFDLVKGTPTPYAPGRVEVVLASTVTGTTSLSVSRATLGKLGRLHGTALAEAAPRYSSSSALNVRLAQLGATKMSRLLGSVSASALARAKAAGSGTSPLDLTRAYVVDVAGAPVPQAVSALLASPDVAYASPDWTVSTMNTQPRPLTKPVQQKAIRPLATPNDGLPALPTNYALSASMQSLLNRPGVNWTQAYDTLQARYHELPGKGEIITNVSLGDLTDANLPAGDACSDAMQTNGPTTVMHDGQRYLDLPSLPLIPTYVAGASGGLDGAASTCWQDPLDTEVDLDFSMMAALPHDQQRAGAGGAGYTDLLGIAPGADYRLVVPATQTVGISDIDAAFLAAAQQTPRPNVITASLGFGFDAYGFPSRYLEDDALTQTLISFITHYFGIVVVVSANDGLRQQTNAAFGPSGGSAATNLVPAGGQPTDLNDVMLSTVPSQVRDSGAIDVGATTLDDIFAAPPQDPANAALAAQHAFPEVRYDGSANYSSGFGSRVNVSAPGDNVIAMEHTYQGGSGDVDAVVEGGTSASAPEVAAGAAIVQQAARLAGDDALATSPTAIRSWLRSTGSPVPNPTQADQPIDVGPQLDLGNAVANLIATRTGFSLPPGVARVAVEQRRPLIATDGLFVGDTDPSSISLADANQNAWITIAPDWTGGPPGAKGKYQLSVGDQTLASTPHARLTPKQILTAAGQSFPLTQATIVTLTYQATFAGGVKVSTQIPLGFGAVSGGTSPHAPVLAGVVVGSTIHVHYDLSDFDGLVEPTLTVSEPGRPAIWGYGWRIAYQAKLPAVSGTIDVPVSALQGGGIYGISIQASPQLNAFSDFAFTRVRGATSDVRPPAPTLSAAGSPAGHQVEVPYGGSFTVSWDVRGVPGAKGANLEIGAGGRTINGSNYSTFNNPNGTVEDHNGLDFGAVHFAALPGTHGTLTLSGVSAGLITSMVHGVRVLPVTSSGAAAGEASDAGAVEMDGVRAPGGQNIVTLPGIGFGVDRNGSGGFVSSGVLDLSSAALIGAASEQRFDQATNGVTRLAASSSSSHLYGTINGGAPGAFTGSVGLYQDLDWAGQKMMYHTFDLTTGGSDAAWTPPDGYLPPEADRVNFVGQVMPADNQTSDDTAFFSGENGHGEDWQLFTSNVKAGTFGPRWSLTPEVASIATPAIDGTAQDTSTDTAVLAASDNTFTSHSKIVTVNLHDGSTSSFDAGTQDSADGIAVDSSSGTALTGRFFGLGLYDLAAKTSTQLDPGGSGYYAPIADSTRGQYLVFEGAGADFFGRLPNPHAPGNIWGLTPNNNALSSVLVLNSQGKLIRRIEKFNNTGMFLRATAALLQVNPSTGIAYAIGQDGINLQPFSYVG